MRKYAKILKIKLIFCLQSTINKYYVFLVEIQKVEEIKNPYVPNSDSKITFVDTVLGLMKHISYKQEYD